MQVPVRESNQRRPRAASGRGLRPVRAPKGPGRGCAARGERPAWIGAGDQSPAAPPDEVRRGGVAYLVQTAQSFPEAASVHPAPVGDQLPGPIFIAVLPFTMAA